MMPNKCAGYFINTCTSYLTRVCRLFHTLTQFDWLAVDFYKRLQRGRSYLKHRFYKSNKLNPTNLGCERLVDYTPA